MKKIFSVICALFAIHCALLNAQVECKTIAEIKSQDNKTEILYTGRAKTTFYNGTYNGLFMEDATGGILLKGYTPGSKSSDVVKDSMEVTNIKATWEVGSTGSAPGLKFATADKKTPIVTPNVPVNPTRVTMAEFFANKASYEGKAIVITDAEISPKVNNKYYLNNAGDSVYFYSSNVSSYAPAGGEMAGVYVGLQYDRFVLCAPEFIKATKFYTFTDMSTYYKGKNYEIVDAEVGGAVLVNYVAKVDETTTAIFAQYLGLTGKLNNGVTIFVEGETTITAGDSIDGFFGKYTDLYVKTMDVTDFKGAYFNQSADKKLNVRSSNNPKIVNADVNISDLKTGKLAFYYASQVITSRYAGKLYAEGDKYYFEVSYEQSNGSDESDSGSMETVVAKIRVVGVGGLNLSQYVGDNVIISGIYDANVIFDEPTIMICDSKDILKVYYEFDNIAEIHAAGEVLSSQIVYALKGEVVVNYKRTQKNSGVSQTWVFVEDETGVLALDFGNATFKHKVGDKIKGIKGAYDDGIRYGTERIGAPSFRVITDASIEVVSSNNELKVVRTTLSEVIRDTMEYCSRIVEISNFVGTSQTLEDLTGVREDYYLYDKANPSLEMHYVPEYHTGDPIIGDNLILKGLVNYNCLDGYYVIYRIEVSEDPNGTTKIEDDSQSVVKFYSVDGSLYIESISGQSIEVYTIDGQCVYSTSNASNITEISDLSGVVIVKVDGVAYKTIVK